MVLRQRFPRLAQEVVRKPSGPLRTLLSEQQLYQDFIMLVSSISHVSQHLPSQVWK